LQRQTSSELIRTDGKRAARMRERSGRFRLDVLLQREYDRFVYRFELRLQSAILDTASISPLTHHMQRVAV